MAEKANEYIALLSGSVFKMNKFDMLFIQRLAGLCVAAFILIAAYKFQKEIPTVGATGEAVNIGGGFYPTAIVLWIFWIITIGIAGLFILYALRPDYRDQDND